jgi:hypothetical protein
MNHIYLICIISIALDGTGLYYKFNIDIGDTFFKYLTLSCQVYILLTNIFTLIYLIKKSNPYLIALKELGLRTFFLAINSIVELRNISLVTSYFYILSYTNWVVNILKLYIFKKYHQIEKVEFNHIEHNFIVIENPIISDICSICLETVQNTKCYKTKCNHIFHTECMKKYVEFTTNNINCPNCREILC